VRSCVILGRYEAASRQLLGSFTPHFFVFFVPFKSLADTCQTEMSRAVRLALWDFTPGAFPLQSAGTPI
jgi:hypothetical protein